MYYSTKYISPLGKIIIVCDGENLNGLWFERQKYFYGTLKEKPIEKDDIHIFKITKQWLDSYFAKEKPNINELPIVLKDSEFRHSVWQILEQIPYGETITYGEISKKVAQNKGIKKMSAQAVGGAVAHNPISIIIPCHRVIGANGNLTGYAGGINIKIKLLEHEGVDISKLFIPKKTTAP